MAVGWVLSRLHSPISVLVIVLLAIAALIGVLGSSFIGTADQYYRDQFLGISVSSYSGYDDPEFLVIIKDHAGRSLKVVYSVYAWMPNGSIVGLGIYGGHGVVKINYSVIKGFSEEWIAHMALRKSDPAKILPSILLLGAVHENGSVYESLRAVPIKTPDVAANKSIVVEIVEDLRGREPIARYNSSAPGTVQRVSLKGSTTLEEFPPGSIFEGCDLACYWWILKEVYGYTIDFLPLIATYVYGPGAYKLHDIYQYIFFKSTSSVEIKAMITARVGKPSTGWFSYSIPGPTITLTGENIWLKQYFTFINGIHFSPPAIVGIGVKAEMASARYKLYQGYCDWSQCYPIYETDGEMNATFTRPVIENNAMVPKILVDPNPYDGQGVLEAAFWEYRNHWSWSETLVSSESVGIDAIDIERSLGTLPSFVVSGGVLGILCRLVVPAASICSAVSIISSIIGASIGPTVSESTYYNAIVNIVLKAEYVGNGMIYANYFKSPDAFRYNSGQYKLGSLYVDAYIA